MISRLVILTLLLTSTARAELITESFAASFSPNYTAQNVDTYGYFGTAGASLESDSVAFTLSYNPSLCTDTSSAGSEGLYPCAAGAMSESVTINSITISVPASTCCNNTDANAQNDNSDDQLQYGATGTVNYMEILLYSTTPFAPGALDAAPSSLDATRTDQLFVGLAGYSDQDTFYITDTAVSTGAPEPATSLLLAAGLFAVLLRAYREKACARAGRR